MSYKIILATRYPSEDPETTTYMSGIKTIEDARQHLLDCREECIYDWLAPELSDDDWHVLTHDSEYRDIFNEAILDSFDYYFNGEDGTFTFEAWIEEEAELDDDLLKLAGVSKKEINLSEFLRPHTSYRSFKDRFYSRAKENILDAEAFHFAFDSELMSLGFNLTDLFTSTSSNALLKNKGTYGIIKKGLEDTDNHVTVRALLRFWVLQFKDGAKLQSDIDKEAEERKKEEREKMLAAHAKYEAERKKVAAERKEKDLERLSAVADRLKDTVSELEKFGLKYAQEVLDEKTIILNSKSAELDNLNNRFNRVRISELDDSVLDRVVLDYEPEIKSIKASTKVEPAFSYSSDSSRGYVSIELLVDIDFPSYYTKRSTPSYYDTRDFISVDVEGKGINLDQCKKEFKNFIDERINKVSKEANDILDYSIARATNKIKECTNARNLGKKVQTQVDSGKDPEPSFFKTLSKLVANGREKATAAKDSWKGLHSDGDAELDYHLTLKDVANNLAYYLIDCNIDTPYGNFRTTTDSPMDLSDILYKVINNNDLTSITIVPSK